MRILIESATESEWVAQCLEGQRHEVIVADPNDAPMRGHRKSLRDGKRSMAVFSERRYRAILVPALLYSLVQSRKLIDASPYRCLKDVLLPSRPARIAGRSINPEGLGQDVLSFGHCPTTTAP